MVTFADMCIVSCTCPLLDIIGIYSSYPITLTVYRGRSRILGGGLITIVTSGGGYGRERAHPLATRGSGGSAVSSPSGVWGKATTSFSYITFAFI